MSADISEALTAGSRKGCKSEFAKAADGKHLILDCGMTIYD